MSGTGMQADRGLETPHSIREQVQTLVNKALTDIYDSSEQAVETAHTTYMLAQESSDPFSIVLSSIVLGSTYGTIGNHEQALQYVAMVQQLCHSILDKEAIIDAFCHYAQHSYHSQNYHYAMQYVSLGLDIARSQNLPRKQAAILNYQSRIYLREQHTDKAIQCLHEALSLISPQISPSGFGNTLMNIGSIYYHSGEIHQALEYYERAVEIGEQVQDRLLLGTCCNNIGILYSLQGQYALALEKFLQCESYVDNTSSNSYANLLNNIGNLYEKMEYYDVAIEYHQKSLSLCRTTGWLEGEASSLHNLGIVYYHTNQHEQARAAYTACIALCEKINLPSTKALSMSGLGSLCVKQGDLASAFPLLEQSLVMARKRNLPLDVTSLLYSFGMAHLNNNDPYKALEALTEALHLAQEGNLHTVLCDIHRALSSVYSLLQQPAKALEHFQQHHAIDKEIRVQIHSQKTQMLQLRHNVEQARKEAEIYRLKNVELATTLAQLETANSKLEQLINEKSELLGIVAHDLKNPINSIMMLADFLNTDENLTPQEIKDFSGDILSSSQRILALITSLLDIALLESKLHALPLSMCNIAPVLHFALRHYAPHTHKKDITLHHDIPSEPLLAYTEQDSLLQVLDNLISNAIKFSPLHSNVWITAQTVAGDDGHSAVRISVRDEGPGLHETDKKQLFQKFAKLSAQPTAGEHSTGLGLSIVKQLADALGATIWCESEQGKGATFIIELPVAASDAPTTDK